MEIVVPRIEKEAQSLQFVIASIKCQLNTFQHSLHRLFRLQNWVTKITLDTDSGAKTSPLIGRQSVQLVIVLHFSVAFQILDHCMI